MGERPDVREKWIDLNVPQVAGAALAAVVAAKLASWFGVYGTILGAGLVSVVATCGGSVFQHLFRRTGEQLRYVTGPTGAPEPERPPRPGEFTAGTVYRARVGSWKRPLVAAALVFGVTMAGITACELASGNSFSGGKGTTVADAVTGQGTSSGDSSGSSGSSGSGESGAGETTSTPSPTPSDDTSLSSSATPGSGATPTPGPKESSGTPTPTPSASEPSATTTPAPAASSRSGTADQDQADPEVR
ncbi:hypothetical protein [Streptomyces sp. NPDC057280]|uniref:hypothetical protein n=1 Tax=Streptomyces sp. NPDC057280 TaxID=3346081 RepID=UPI00362A93C2